MTAIGKEKREILTCCAECLVQPAHPCVPEEEPDASHVDEEIEHLMTVLLDSLLCIRH